MIKYSLQCDEGHQFDGWFNSSSAYDEQRARGLVSCPICGSESVEKMLMAPAVTGTKKQGTPLPDGVVLGGDGADGTGSNGIGSNDVGSNAGATQEMAPTGPVLDGEVLPATIPEPLVHGNEAVKAVVNKMRELRQWVETNADNVGDKFATEARKMHYGEEETRGIFGKATFDEAQELIEEGVDFLPLPGLPEDQN